MHRGISLLLTLLAVFSLTSCIDGLTSYSIEYPQNNVTYIGTQYENAPNDDGSPKYNRLGTTFTVNYGTPPSSQLAIVLNGNDIGEYFDYGPASATVDIQKIKQFFRQGKNTFSVEPLSFGPQLIFFLDAEGPTLVIERGESLDKSETVQIEGFLRDFSNYSDSLTLELFSIDGYDGATGNIQRTFVNSVDIPVDANGKFCACDENGNAVDIRDLIVPETYFDRGEGFPAQERYIYTPGKYLIYSFIAEDEHGYKTEIEIAADTFDGDLADGQTNAIPVKDSVRMAVGDTLVKSLRPLIAAGLKTALDEEPIDMVFDNPSPLYVDIGLGNMPTYLKRFYMADGNPLTVDGRTIQTSKGTMLLNNFVVLPDSALDVDLVIVGILVDLTIELPGWISWLISSLDLSMYIDKVTVDTRAIAKATNNQASVQLDTNNTNFGLQGIELTKTKAGNLDITGLAGALIPLLEGLIGGLLPGIVNPVLNDNLSRLAFGQRVWRNDLLPEQYTRENDPVELPAAGDNVLPADLVGVPYADINLEIYELGTGNLLGPSSPYDLLVSVQSKADTQVADPHVKPMLGSFFSDDPINPALVYNSLGNSGTNISLALKSNLINQLLGSVYSIGQMHLTLYDGKTIFGANPHTPANEAGDATTAAKGDGRIRLWPDMPPIFAMTEVIGSGGTGKASITYPSATLAIEEWDGTNWQKDIELKVDFDIAILVDEKEGAVTLGAAGPPVFNVNDIVNNTNIQVPEIAIQAVLDAALFFGGDALADQLIALDLNDLAEAGLNGQVVEYQDANDRFTLANDECATFKITDFETGDGVWGRCKIDDDACDPENNPLTIGSGGDGYDLICQEINFLVQTDTVGVIGNEGSNLFFQMGARDPALPPAPAIPRFDLDDDGIIDYRDNCALSQYDLAQVIKDVEANEGVSLYVGVDGESGEPTATYEAHIRDYANKLMARVFGGDESATPSSSGDILTNDVAFYNTLRKGDDPIASGSLGPHPWLRMLFSNKEQLDNDGDRIGELCEDDRDRDGIYADNLTETPADNCPGTYNPDQTDNIVNRDADGNLLSVGDLCDVSETYVLIQSMTDGKCLTHGGVDPGANNKSKIGQMVDCNPFDVNQRFYMNLRWDQDDSEPLNDHFHFFTKEIRDHTSPALAYWQHHDQNRRALAIYKADTAATLNSGRNNSIAGKGQKVHPGWLLSPPIPADVDRLSYDLLDYPFFLNTVDSEWYKDCAFRSKFLDDNYQEGSAAEQKGGNETGRATVKASHYCYALNNEPDTPGKVIESQSRQRWSIRVGNDMEVWNAQWPYPQ